MMLIVATIMLILLDAALTYIGVSYLGAREVVLVFVNQAPALMWLFAVVKVAAAVYLAKKMKKYSWIKYGFYIIIFLHVVAVVNNAYLILWS